MINAFVELDTLSIAIVRFAREHKRIHGFAPSMLQAANLIGQTTLFVRARAHALIKAGYLADGGMDGFLFPGERAKEVE